MQFYDSTVEQGSSDSCLRPILKTGDEKTDQFYEALQQASAADLALFAIAMQRKEREANQT